MAYFIWWKDKHSPWDLGQEVWEGEKIFQVCQTGLYQLTLTASVKRSLSLATVAAMPSSTRNSLAST